MDASSKQGVSYSGICHQDILKYHHPRSLGYRPRRGVLVEIYLVILRINNLILNGNGQKLQKKSFLGPEVGTNRPEVARNGAERDKRRTKNGLN